MHSLVARKALAFAKWQYPYVLTAEQKTKKAQLDRNEELEHPLPEGSNRELYDAFFAALREKKAKWMDESKDYCKSESAITGFHLSFWHVVGVYSASDSEKPSNSKVYLARQDLWPIHYHFFIAA